MKPAKQLYYGNGEDQEYDIQPDDEVVVIAGEFRVPAIVKAVLPKLDKVVVSFEGTDQVLDIIALRKTARVPAAALDLIGRAP